MPRHSFPSLLLLASLATSLPAAQPLHADVPVAIGLPMARSYTFEEIGNVSPGIELSSDALGRLMAIQEGVCIVFDDKNWTDILEREASPINITQLARSPASGRMYFGSSGNWGYLDYLPSGEVGRFR